MPIDNGIEQAARLLRRECCHTASDFEAPCCSWTMAARDVEHLLSKYTASQEALTELLTEHRKQGEEVERLREAGALLGEAFDLGVFVRGTKGDGESDWAIKLLPYLRALAVLVEDVSESESTQNQEENDG